MARAKSRGQGPAGATAWYRSRSFQLAVALILGAALALGGNWLVGANTSDDPASPGDGEEDLTEEVTATEEALIPLDAELSDVTLLSRQAMEALESGELSSESFLEQMPQWHERLRSALEGINDLEVPSTLEESRALFAYGAVLLIDSLDPLRTAAARDAEERRSGFQAVKSIQDHAHLVLGMAKREMEQEKDRWNLGLDITRGMFIEDPIPLPEPPPAPGGPES